MRYIDLSQIDLNDSDVQNWLLKAQQHLNALMLLQTHKDRAEYFKAHNIWSDLKPTLVKICGKKCWYSECPIEGDHGDVDHFRPKNRSLDVCGNVQLEDGYWWLAYDYMNYRLSCSICNQTGKRDFFPVKPGSLPGTQGNTANEIPLLLDPCNKHDTELVGYNEHGCVIPLTNDPWEKERVNQSRKLYALGQFDSGRRKVQCDCKIALEIFEILYENNPIGALKPVELLKHYTSDGAQYSSAAQSYVSNWIVGKPYEQDLRTILNIPAPPNSGSDNQNNSLLQAVGV